MHFQNLYRQYFSLVSRHVNYLMGGNSQIAEEIAQETFVRLYTSPPVTGDNLSAWLLRVATNLTYNYLKSDRRRVDRETRVYTTGADNTPEGCLPEEVLMRNQQVLAVKEVLEILDNFGSVENKQTGEQRQVKWSEAANFLSFEPQQPSYMPDGLDFNQTLSVEPANTIEFTLNVKNVNTVIEHLGGQYPLPAALEGKSFGLNFHETLQAYADAGQGGTYRNLRLVQTRSPEVTVPDNVDVAAVRKAILEMPMIPNETKQKLASLSDWQNTLYIPSPDSGTAEELTINGSSGVFIKEDWGNSRNHSLLIWQDSGVLFVIDGTNVERGEIVKVAESLK